MAINSLFTVVALLAATATCAPQPLSRRVDQPSPPYGPWNVSEYRTNCFTQQGQYECVYSFKMDFAPDPKYPAPGKTMTELPVSASCVGSSLAGFMQCDGLHSTVLSMLNVTEDATTETLTIHHTYDVNYDLPMGSPGRELVFLSGNTTVAKLAPPGGRSFQVFANSGSAIQW